MTTDESGDPLSEDEARAGVSDLPGWSVSEGAVAKEYELPSFAAAISFVNQVAGLAETADHHPDIDIRYNKVRISLVTHSAGGITGKDVEMAGRIERECAPPS